MKEYEDWDPRKHIAFKRRKSYVILTNETKAVLNEYELKQEHVKKLWSIFNKLDDQNIGYITVDKIMLNLSEREYSIVAPFTYRFFDIIDKELSDRIAFQEFVVGLIFFCTFTR